MTGSLIDVHSHYTGRSREAVAPLTSDTAALRAWAGFAAHMRDLPRLLDTQDELGISMRVLGAPPALITPRGARLSGDELFAFNTEVAEAVRAHPERLAGLATVDAFAGDAGAQLLERAIVELGLHGAMVDCADGHRLLDAPEARPVLEAAARLGVPVFMHPVSVPPLAQLLPGLGEWTETLARGTSTAASLIALMRSGTLDAVAGLRLIMPWLGGVALVLAGLHGGADQLRAGAAVDRRWHVYVDTMGLEPHALRYAAELLGDDHVLMGSDWPIMSGDTSRARVDAALARAGFTAEAADRIRSGNARALFHLP